MKKIDIRIGATYEGKRGGVRAVNDISADDQVEYEVIQPVAGQTRYMTLEGFAKWALREVTDAAGALGQPIEETLFSWEDWQMDDPGVLSFAECTLKVDLAGDLLAGSEVSSIIINMPKSALEVYIDDGPDCRRFHIGLTVHGEA